MVYNRKQHIERSFGKNCESYHRQATLQKNIAQNLAEFLPKKDNIKILEIGCGTGFLTEKLNQLYPKSQFVISDVSYDMIAFCRQRFIGYNNMNFQTLDGDHINLDTEFDLIVSSMCVQWFQIIEH